MSDSRKPAAGKTTGANSAKRKASWLAGILYVLSALLAVIFVYMVIVNVIYIKNYIASYRMTFADMWMDTTQYVITGSISYLVYAVLVFCAGRVISLLTSGRHRMAGEAVVTGSALALPDEQANVADAADAEQEETAAVSEKEFFNPTPRRRQRKRSRR